MNRMLKCGVAAFAVAIVAVLGMTPVSADDGADEVVAHRDALTALAEGEHRSADNKARNQFRNPVETLLFMGIRPDMTVVELYPGGGWYTEIIAPFVREKGLYYAAAFDQDSDVAYMQRVNSMFAEKLAAEPDLYDRAVVTELAPPDKTEIAPEGSADLVLTFRNLHSFIGRGEVEDVFAAAYRALKPGGVLGLVAHRADPDTEMDPEDRSGYVTEAHAIALAEAAGFVFDTSSEINANPKDTKDYEEGVWTLPPSLRLGDQDRDRYMAIGESDRMTLRFVKPAE